MLEMRAAEAQPGRGRGAPAVRTPLLQRLPARLQRRGAAGARPAGGAQLRLRHRRILPGRGRTARAGESGVGAMIRTTMNPLMQPVGAAMAAMAFAARFIAAMAAPTGLVLMWLASGSESCRERGCQ